MQHSRRPLRRLPELLAITILLAPSAALAYVGPGAGLSMIGSLLAVVGAVLLALVGLVLFPVRLLVKRRRAATVTAATHVDTAADRADR